MYREFDSENEKQVATLIGYQGGAIAVSPDETSVLYSRFDQFHADLMLVEGFE
jgi:hypothetical protein